MMSPIQSACLPMNSSRLRGFTRQQKTRIRLPLDYGRHNLNCATVITRTNRVNRRPISA